ncbi:MAG: Na+/H+ antiporter NhaA, partial [Saprospiraceae bacterium]
RLQHWLHRPVAFGILPLFALANTGIGIPSDWAAEISSPNSLGILAGLVLGKPLGIILFTGLAVALGWCALPDGLRRVHLLGSGLLAGIGFTMSIFITLLAFEDAETIVHTKIAVFLASLLAGLGGYLLLNLSLPRSAAIEDTE